LSKSSDQEAHWVRVESLKAYSDPASTFMTILLRISILPEMPLKANNPRAIHPLGIFPCLSHPDNFQDKLQSKMVGPNFHHLPFDLIIHQKSSNFIDQDFIALPSRGL